jgi:hypothetical protein
LLSLSILWQDIVAIKTLSAHIRNYDDVFAAIFFHHRDTEGTEDIFLFAPQETAMGKKVCAFGDTKSVC